MDLLLEYQNKEFMQFCSDRDLFLQETNKIFKLHIFSVDTLTKFKRIINKVIISLEQTRRHSSKNVSFDILSLAYQLYQ